MTFLPLDLHLQVHEKCFNDIFASFILVIELNTLTFKSSILFRTQLSLMNRQKY